MKNILVSVLLLISSAAMASPEDFSFDEKAINNTFADLQTVEQLVEEKHLTLEELQVLHPSVVENIPLSQETALGFEGKELPLVGAFWWGCCLGVLGLALVYFITDGDRQQLKSAAVGCVIFMLVGGGLWGFVGKPF